MTSCRPTQLPGWRWSRGMIDATGRVILRVDPDGRPVEWAVPSVRVGRHLVADWPAWPNAAQPDLDDRATGGCLLAMLGDHSAASYAVGVWMASAAIPFASGQGTSLGRACFAVALALGRWPGGAP